MEVRKINYINTNQKYIASFSGGKDSLAMVLKLIEKKKPLDEVVFFDTGMEFQAIYNIRDKIIPILKDHQIIFTQLKPKFTFLYGAFERPICHRGTNEVYKYGESWCGGACRWFTNQKISTLRKYIPKDAIQYVGIAADETSRFEKASCNNKVLPLVEWEMTEKDCLRYCYDRGYNWNENGVELYDILDRVSCWCCANKNRKELKNIYIYLPEYWEKLKDFQSKTTRPMKKYSKKGVPYGNVFDMEKVFEKECM